MSNLEETQSKKKGWFRAVLTPLRYTSGRNGLPFSFTGVARLTRKGYKNPKLLLGLIVAVTIVTIANFPKLYKIDWVGFGADSNKSVTIEQVINPKDGKIIELRKTTEHFQSGKTLWDWLGLVGTIAIPVVLYQFQRSEQKQIEINSREEAMLAYFKHISELLIDKELKLLIIKKQKDKNFKDPKLDALLDAARACTLSILRRLDEDGERKGRIIRFLSDSGLIGELNLEHASLNGANLNNVKLKGAFLGYAKLNNADLSLTDERIIKAIKDPLSDCPNAEVYCADTGVQLYCADLQNANLSKRYLVKVNLSNANLRGADLRGTDLRGADLHGANFTGANLDGALYSGNEFIGAILPDSNKYESIQQLKQFGVKMKQQ